MNRTILPVVALLLGIFGATFAAHAGTASADNVVIDTGQVSYRIKHIDVADTPLDNAALASLLDAKTPQPLAQRLAAVTAGTITMPEVVVEMKHAASVDTLIYRDVKLSDVKAGHVGALSIAGASLAATTPKYDDLHGTIGTITASDVDMALVARIATVARTDPAEPRKPIYGHYAIASFTLASAKAGFDLSIGPITGSGALGRALETPLTALGSELEPRPGEAKTATRARATHVLIDLLGSLELGSFEAKTINVRSTMPDKPATVSLASLALTSVGPDKLGGLSLEGFAMETPQVKVSFGSLSLQNLDLAAFRKTLSVAEAGGDPSAVAQQMPSMSGQMALKDVSVGVAATGNGNTADGQRTTFHIDSIAMAGTPPAAASAMEFGTELDHFVMAVPPGPDSSLKSVAAMGYSKLDLSSRLGIAWNEARKELQVKTISLTGDGMGTLTVSGLFSNVSKDLFSSDPAVMQAAALGMLLDKIDLRIDNAGLVDKAIAMQARNDGKSVDEMRRAYVTGAGVAVPVMLGNGPGAKAIGAALAKFVAKPRSFHLVATAPNGFGASDLEALGDPAALLDKLNIEASANE